jgi:hypothetical protein
MVLEGMNSLEREGKLQIETFRTDLAGTMED